MRGSEILKEIDQRHREGDRFIRWWRRENDFADYELLEDFRRRVDGNQEFEGFELLDIEEMWETLNRLGTDDLTREKRKDGEVVIWRHVDSEGREKEIICPFTPENLMKIFDVETRGNTLV